MRWKASAGAGVHAAVPNAARAPTSATAALLLSVESSTAAASCRLCASSCRDTHGRDLACLWGLSRRCGTC